MSATTGLHKRKYTCLKKENTPQAGFDSTDCAFIVAQCVITAEQSIEVLRLDMLRDENALI